VAVSRRAVVTSRRARVRRVRRVRLVHLVYLVHVVAACLLATACSRPPPPVAVVVAPPDLEALRANEATAAKLALRLDAFAAAVTVRDEAAMRAAFADDVAFAYPGELEVPWSQGCGAPIDEPVLRFEGGAVPSTLSADAAAHALATFLARRTTVRAACAVTQMASERPLLGDSPGPGRRERTPALFSFTIEDRDDEGRREWISGWGSFDATGDRIAGLDLHESRLVATRDLFVDVSKAAGVERPDPTLMDRGGRGLLSHGVAAADVDGDGLIDVFATGLAQHALFRNRGDGTFEDVADAARVAHSAHPDCAPLFLDADGDGDQDLFLSGLGGCSLFENRLVPDGRLAFRDVSSAAGVEIERDAFSVAAGDVNGDGRPDLAVACYGDYGPVVPDSWVHAANGQPNLLLLNESSAQGLKFREAAKELGCDDARWSYCVLLADVDDDGDLDEIVANDFGGDIGLFINDRGHFTDRAAERGLGGPAYAMGLSLGDPDCDGDLDLFVTKASSVAPARMLSGWPLRDETAGGLVTRLASGDTLYENAGGGAFRQRRWFATGWSWGGGFVDLDGDGWTDLHVPGGFLTGTGPGDTDDAFWEQVVESVAPGGRTKQEFFAMQVPAILHEGASFAGHERDSVFLDVHGCFVDVSGVSGLDSETDGRGAAYADFDDDGDPDIFLRAMHSRAHLLFRNDLAGAHGFVRIALQGTASGRDACGAIVLVRFHDVDGHHVNGHHVDGHHVDGHDVDGHDVDGARLVAQAKLCGSGFLSQSDPRLVFGCDHGIDSIDVAWPSGAKQSFGGASSGTSLLLVEGEATPRIVTEHAFRLGGAP
jgi:hypothetical protein